MKLGALTLGAYRLIINISFWSISPFIIAFYGMSSSISFDQCRFEVYFVQDKYATPACFGGGTGLVNILPAFHPKPMLISVSVMGLLQATDCWIFLFNPACEMVYFDGRIMSINIQC
jgi:hypothetical protein